MVSLVHLRRVTAPYGATVLGRAQHVCFVPPICLVCTLEDLYSRFIRHLRPLSGRRAPRQRSARCLHDGDVPPPREKIRVRMRAMRTPPIYARAIYNMRQVDARVPVTRFFPVGKGGIKSRVFVARYSLLLPLHPRGARKTTRFSGEITVIITAVTPRASPAR